MGITDIINSKTVTRRRAIGLLGLGAIATQFPYACIEKKTNTDFTEELPLHYLTLTEVSKQLKSGKISSAKLTQLMLDRINLVDPKLHSYATVMAEQALEAAHKADQKISSNEYLGQLHGVPIAVKDLFYIKGVQTMGGLTVLRNFVPNHDATVVSKLEAAGAVILGKLNLTEGALPGYHRSFEIPINPWGDDLWAGASSSGSGVATAAGLCFATLGTDTGGSIRFPSMANGIVGLKPTYGRVSRHGVLPLAESLDHVGPMTRRTADAALVFEVIAGSDPNDSTSLSDPVPNMLQELNRGVDGLHIGYDRQYSTEGVDPSLVASITTALEQLESMGAQIIDLKMPESPNILNTIAGYEAYAFHSQYYPARAGEYGNFFREFLANGAKVTNADYVNAKRLRLEFITRFNAILSSVDAIVSPAGGVPFTILSEVQYAGTAELRDALKIDFRFTFPANLAGTPTLSLPCGFSEAGLPHTIQFWGKRLSEPTLCRIGHAYEEATSWHKKHPPI